MPWITLAACTLLAYLLGSFPSGLVWVRVFTGQDVREVGSGRTGGTNAMRAAGFWVGLLTATTDIGKGTLAVWLAGQMVPPPLAAWAMVAAGLAVIVGHNYPIWLGFKGGAGGAPATGAAIAMWPWLAPLAVLQGAFILYFIGYASIATIMTAVTSTIVFAILAYAVSPAMLSPEFIVYGVGAIILLAWALRPNFDRLRRGEERLVGRRAKKRRQVEAGPSGG